MKHTIIIVIGIAALIAIFFFVFKEKGEEIPLPILENQDGRAQQTIRTPYGFAYTYPTDEYTRFTPEDATSGMLVFTESVLDTDDYKDLQESEIPREGPRALTISVYRNPQSLSTREWITQNDVSNYKLSADGTISTVTLGQTEFLTYQFDGLYRADAYVYSNNGYVYLFTNMWENPQSAMKKDMEEVIASLQWTEPEILAASVHNDIEVTLPSAGSEITSPLSIEGKAKGFWYFEATFPVELRDENGEMIAQGYAEAQGDWMTTNFVPFTAELTFTAPAGIERGTLILRKSNASGLPEHDDAIEVPVAF